MEFIMTPTLVFSAKKVLYLLNAENDILKCNYMGKAQILHDHPIIEYDADIDPEDNLHIVLLSAMGLLIYCVVNQSAKNVFTLSKIHTDTQRVNNLRISAQKGINIFYTISTLPFIGQTLIHYAHSGEWTGARIMEFAPHIKNLSISVDGAFTFYAAYSASSNWILKKIDYNQKTKTDLDLDKSAQEIRSVNACNGHCAYTKGDTVYFDGKRVCHGREPVILIRRNEIYCLVLRGDSRVLLKKQDTLWQSVYERNALPLCNVRGDCPITCSKTPFDGKYFSPLGVNERPYEIRSFSPQIETRLKKLEDQFQIYTNALTGLQSRIAKLQAEIDRLNRPSKSE